MKKTFLTIIALTLLIPITFCQDNTEVVDKITKEICNDLNEVESIDSLTDYGAKLIIGKAILKHNEEWDRELDKIENSRGAGKTVFDYLLNHRLQQNCDKFISVDNKLDKYLIDNVDFRKLYLSVKDFVITAEIENEVETLVKFFNSDIDKEELNKKLQFLKDELDQYKRLSGLYIIKTNDQLNFHVNVFDYKTGDENVAIMIVFNDLSDSLIDDWNFKTKQEIEAERAQEEDDFDDFPLPPPAP
ncbi:hypothetical protein ACFLTE_08145 [Bacteroidota bacterium]